MYGKSPVTFPQRIVCLSAEHVEICYALGAGDRVVGGPGTAHPPPDAPDKPNGGRFTTFRANPIPALQPDPGLALSDHPAHTPPQPTRACLPVLSTHPPPIDR